MSSRDRFTFDRNLRYLSRFELRTMENDHYCTVLAFIFGECVALHRRKRTREGRYGFDQQLILNIGFRLKRKNFALYYWIYAEISERFKSIGILQS